eukprot:GSChrysophyteH2.ASY1.ANO1.947.1 assembled CDS
MTSVANLKLTTGSDDEGAGGLPAQAPSTPGSQDVTAASSPMDHPTLLAAVRKQIEYYFSKENLERDAYLTSQMDASNSVPISVVMKFSKMKSLVNGDESIVREALQGSAVCPVGDDSRIRALSLKAGGRSTIILRDIPSDTAEAAVREIFNFEAMKGRNLVSIRPDIENTWFVVLDTETDAKDTLLDLKLKRRMFNGQSVKARLKTEVALRSFYSQPPPVPVPAMGGYAGGDRAGGRAQHQQGQQQMQQGGRGSAGDAGRQGQQGSTQGGRPGASNAKGSPNARTGAGAAGGANDRQGNTRGQTKGGKGAAAPKQGSAHVPVPVDLNLQNFPPLHADESPVPQAGYQGAYHKYTADDIISIVSKVKEAPMPLYALNGLPLKPSDHGHAMTATPNNDLLRRQRSFSIDETREQLQQGKPVQREAVAAGAVDYASMIYGDVRTSSIDESGLRDAIVTSSSDVPAPVRSAPGSAPGSAPRSRSNSYQQGHGNNNNNNNNNKGNRNEQPKGANAVPSASSWAALVKSSSTSSTQTEPLAKAPTSPARNDKHAAKESKISNNTSNSKGTSANNKEDDRVPANAGKGRSTHNRQPRKENKVCVCVCLFVQM